MDPISASLSGGEGGVSIAPTGATASNEIDFGDYYGGNVSSGNTGINNNTLMVGLAVAALVAIVIIKR